MIIGIAGVGGIGSNVAVNLVRSGVSCLKIIDFDRVETSNLNRQFYFRDQIGGLKVEMLAENLRRIRANVRIETAAVRIDAANCREILADCRLIVEGLDRKSDKKMLIETLAGEGRIIVSACGIAGHDMDGIRVKRLGGCTIVGDFVTDCAQAPLFAHKVSTVADIMTDIILEQGGYYD
ncbi:MAG: sulfur carrier protein ThiS adenylyltransferase ThiF [Pseudomonadota bacterium]